jgi:spore coat protein CotF
MVQSVLQDEDLLYIILADLKRVSREYTTATTESNCETVRSIFQDLTMDSLKLQGELYQFMSQYGMYDTSSPTVRPEIQSQITSYTDSQQKTNQLLTQNMNINTAFH